MSFSSQNFETYITRALLLHAARLMTWLIGVRPTVDQSWKALIYLNVIVSDSFCMFLVTESVGVPFRMFSVSFVAVVPYVFCCPWCSVLYVFCY